MQNLKPILLVEDDHVDAMTVKRIFTELKVKNQLAHVVDGEKALEYLRNSKNRKPCVILLDLNMPRMNGIEFLKIIKADDDLRSIPVIVLTTSREDQDKIDSFKLGIAGYILKTVDYKRFATIMEIMDMYWTLSELPGETVKQCTKSL
jgi:CheY-like chemotaxis protein